MTENVLRRDRIKYIRDKAKSLYGKGSECEICGSDERLDFHHFYSMTPLLNVWLKKKQTESPSNYTDELIMNWRDEFITEHNKEIYEDTVTLCHAHHQQLHSIYGRNPALVTAKKQIRWVGIQKDKHELV